MASTYTLGNWYTITVSQQAWMEPTAVISGSKTAVYLAQNEQVNARNNHIGIKTHHIKELVQTKP